LLHRGDVRFYPGGDSASRATELRRFSARENNGQARNACFNELGALSPGFAYRKYIRDESLQLWCSPQPGGDIARVRQYPAGHTT
jgi:hypothetical protein